MDESAHTPDHDRPTGDPAEQETLPTVAPRPGIADEPEIEDAGPEPHLDPEVEARVQALLAEASDPGPMPDAVADRISTALLDAARLRVDPGPLVPGAPGSSTVSDTHSTGHTGGSVLAMPSRADRPKPIYLAAAIAAAAAVVAVGASALHVTKRPNGAAVVGDRFTSGSTRPTPAPSTNGGLHIQLSTTAYDETNLASEARQLLEHPGQPIRDLAAEAPSIGPIATPIGLESCLEAIGALDAASPAPEAVSADLATYDGRPAVVVVVTRSGVSTAWAVERSCTTGSPGVLKDATPVP
ncbi:hypothetical protein ACFQU3_12490 [Terrabacter sp. GCM10028922]|uniref:hypothetical protein n=1 Tax=Terrabacter sp. GCM10028922 TaxID=3273428 RepID=UPI00361010A9